MHEKFEALSVLKKQQKHPNFDQMLKQLIEKLPLLMANAMNRCVIEEIINLLAFYASLTTIDMAI